MELLIGSGHSKKKLAHPIGCDSWDELVTLDINADTNPDVVHDLNVTPLPFDDNTFDEIHAYQVLEHIGRQGDYVSFFKEFSEYWRILKPWGKLTATVPSHDSVWAWGDPGHTRTIQKETLIFLCRSSYKQNIDAGSEMTDYSKLCKCNFVLEYAETKDWLFCFVLKAIKWKRRLDENCYCCG